MNCEYLMQIRREILRPLFGRLHQHKVTAAATFAALALGAWLALPPGQIFPEKHSKLVLDRNGRLLRATLAMDQQYRFPPDRTTLPQKYATALVSYEDKRFYAHPGVDPLALAQAFLTNLQAGKRLRGGSTIPMQVARLAKPKSRSYFNKLLECLTAVKLTLHFSKEEILALYAANVPMGGNIVGIEAASYAYLGKPAMQLTWAEAALFVVLPNSPATINLERSRDRLLKKRNYLLQKLAACAVLDTLSMQLACAEPLPGGERQFPFQAGHFTEFALSRAGEDPIIETTLDQDIQKQAEAVADQHHATLAGQGIDNLAILAVESQTGKVRAYVGSNDFYDKESNGQVDGVQAWRSTGSLLKPFLVAKALDRGPYTMSSKIQDVPTFYGTFAPQNASKSHSGLASLSQVLLHSLNVPAVRLLNAYGVADFYADLKQGGLTSLFRTPQEYGLTLILGGAEASLFELTRLYLALANAGQKKQLAIFAKTSEAVSEQQLFSAGASWLVVNTLKNLARPGGDYYWRYFDNQTPVAWKTGTSYGQKDAWAIGVNRQWLVGVWVGNFTGEGNAALSGAQSAAPVLFDIFNSITALTEDSWFEEPEYDLKSVEVCSESGYAAGPYCPEKRWLHIPFDAHVPGSCPFHRRYLVDRKTGRSVCSLCWQDARTEWVVRYIVPAGVRNILERNGYDVDIVPRHKSNCINYRDDHRMALLYPVAGIGIFIPRDFDGAYEQIVFSAVHQQPGMHLFWYLNGAFIRETVDNHQFAFQLTPGTYTLTIEDETGITDSVSFKAFWQNGKPAEAAMTVDE